MCTAKKLSVLLVVLSSHVYSASDGCSKSDCVEFADGLEELDLNSTCYDSESWVEVINSLPISLKKLELEGSGHTPESLCVLNRLEQLEKLDLRDVELVNPSDWNIVIENLPTSLKELGLAFTNPSGESLRGLYRLGVLEELDLEGIELENRSDWLEVIDSLPPSLKKLDLDDTNLSGESLFVLHRLKQLEELNLPYITLDDSADWVQMFQSWPTSLKKLELKFTTPSKESLCVLHRFEQLEKLDLSYKILDNPNDWVQVLQFLPTSLKEFHLHFTNSSGESLCVLHRLEQLEKLDLRGVELVNPSDWNIVIENLPTSLKELGLAFTNLSREILGGLNCLERLERLEELGLGDIRLANRRDWNVVIKNLPRNLKRLKLEHTNCPGNVIEKIKAKGIEVHIECLENIDFPM